MLKLRVQLQPNNFNTMASSPYQCFKNIIRQHGYKSLTRGLLATQLRDTTGIGIYFASYEYMARKMSKDGQMESLTSVQLLLAGGMAGTFSWMFNYPVDVIKTRFQADDSHKTYVQSFSYKCCNLLYCGMTYRLLIDYDLFGKIFPSSLPDRTTTQEYLPATAACSSLTKSSQARRHLPREDYISGYELWSNLGLLPEAGSTLIDPISINRRPSMPDPSTTDPQLIFRKFLEFLETDMWLLPINNFMEQNSIAFEREQGDPETFVKIYKKFTELIDTLMDSYCQDTGINGQHLVEALKSTDKSSKLSYKEKVLLEPIVASQDFNIFVPMMMRKNIELQLQALKMLELFKLDEDDAEIWKVLFDEDESERLILISVLKQSREEFEHDQRMREEWQKQLDAATQNSLKEKQLLESMRKMEQSRLDEAMKKTEEKFKNMSIGGEQTRIFSNLILENAHNTASSVSPAASTSTKHAIVVNKTSNSISANLNPNTSTEPKNLNKLAMTKVCIVLEFRPPQKL
uniref:Cilia- and flagella-associated protein 36 n=1 Tax=Ditylenchus dipsaci TaxID=166011 RepID=A0A915D7V5_9BILA